MTSQDLLIVIAVVVVLAAVVWYVRGRREERAAISADPDLPRERVQAHVAAEEAKDEAVVRRYCPSCQTEREFRGGVCLECGYRFN